MPRDEIIRGTTLFFASKRANTPWAYNGACRRSLLKIQPRHSKGNFTNPATQCASSHGTHSLGNAFGKATSFVIVLSSAMLIILSFICEICNSFIEIFFIICYDIQE